MMNSAPSILFDDLRVERSGRVVIPRLSASVAAGQITGLLGPSGCGKSTLMRSIVGVQKVTSGTVQVLGEPAGSAGLRRRIGYVTQAPSVYGDLTVEENLNFFAAVVGAPAGARDRVIETVGLQTHTEQLVARLSGGQQSRASLAVALLSEPEVLVLDEPTVGLDPLLRRQLWQTFAELAATGVTLIVSSHVMDEAERCDRLLLMREGELIADEAPDVLLAQTHTHEIEDAFVALIDKEVAR